MGEPAHTTGKRDDRRRARLRDELVDAGLPVPDGQGGDQLMDELAHAVWAGIHEHRRFGYGCILDPCDPAAVGDPVAEPAAPVLDGGPLSELRRYADGQRLFLVRSQDDPPKVVAVDVPDEIALVRLHRLAGGTIVRRVPDGVQVVTEDGTVGSYSGRWSLTPSLTSSVDTVGDIVRLSERDVLCQILDLCLHVLSPRHVGATIVWRLRTPTDDRLTRPPQPGPLELSVVDDRHLDAVAKRVALLDGACVLERDGTVAGFGAFLGRSRATEDRVAYEAGLRHSSARWYSNDVPEALVFVVSEDGPVTVYRDGSVLLPSDDRAADERLREASAPW